MYITIKTDIIPDNYLIAACANAARLSHKNNKQEYLLQDQLSLLSKLVLHGDDEAKSLRGLQVYYSLTAPRYFWHEFVTYRIGNEQLGSESTMHSAPKFENKEEHYCGKSHPHLRQACIKGIWKCNECKEKDKNVLEEEFLIWKDEIKEGLLQTRYFMTNYQTLRRMYFARRNHRLPHWREFCEWIETLPYAKELIIKEK